jgi:hypothetical protein
MHVCAQGLKSLFGKDNGVLKQPKDGEKAKKKDRYCCNVLCCVATRCTALQRVVLCCNVLCCVATCSKKGKENKASSSATVTESSSSTRETKETRSPRSARV